MYGTAGDPFEKVHGYHLVIHEQATGAAFPHQIGLAQAGLARIRHSRVQTAQIPTWHSLNSACISVFYQRAFFDGRERAHHTLLSPGSQLRRQWNFG
ncbi:uncharacterized protein LAESUDRAFT_449940 [Laetiporus sulphureus 93-53]|uniref:Uncharacterized protein n=1 Tax=Laetiporus sulphureus 93-53 TaxID=1314785 RepID=A0A165BZF9_9APHY|nr:uncharacterized protein LAESUDRAFT_449940 [Laetiporus sulphureus 93-53]KZT01930.1 hypothetical protein LAESUDRAFT_449940 [Laetiporus sulphureus 93-53]